MVAATLDALMPAIAALANTPRRDRGATRGLYSYPAKFQAHLPAELVRLLSRPGDLVVDPWAGGGTTALEAMLQGRPSVTVDLNPFACLIARVKTTPLAATDVLAAGEAAATCATARPILDEDDVRCLGPALADEAARLAAGSDRLPPPLRDAVRLALIHALKIAGRRDFDGASLRPLFRRRIAHMAEALAALPTQAPRPRVECRSNHALPVVDGAARLVVTSPPYKDLDVEYGLLQLQRRALRRSKRSRAIWALLDEAYLPKRLLCGGSGEAYFAALAPALVETRRVLAPGAPAFFWIGFKTDADRRRFVAALHDAGLPVRHEISVSLGRDRVASSRSTHHGRATGMMSQDRLFVAIAA